MTSDRTELVVVLDQPRLGPARPVGVLTHWGGPRPAITFAYARSWLAATDRFQVDPRLLLVDGIQHGPGNTIPSVLLDTAPDAWGRLLMERRAGHGLEPWDFLVGVADGTRMGALRLRRPADGVYIDDREPAVPPIADLRALQAAAAEFDRNPNRPPTDPILDTLVAPGSSLGGARPKANFRGTDGGLWIAKFPSRSDDRHDIGAWELVFARLAVAAGIRVSDVDLMSLGGHGRTFVTRRFDRDTDGGRRLFASAETVADVEPERAGYPDIARAITLNGSPETIRADLAQLFRRLVFNILAGNRDDHLHNHGFLRSEGGWRLAPAFDMNPSRMLREHSLTIDGTTHAPDLAAAFATRGLYGLGETQARDVVAEVVDALAGWPAEAARVGIAEAEQRIVAVTFAQLDAARR